MFVLPSYDEGMPNAVLEALACETPTIATTVGDIPSLPNGLLLTVPPGNRTRLLEAMQKIINGEFKINEFQRSSLLEECSIKNHQVNLKKIIEETS
jgi:glycosyltransferase involved in cell wall biosynthesis